MRVGAEYLEFSTVAHNLEKLRSKVIVLALVGKWQEKYVFVIC